jgi:hypothetical protein
MDREARGAPLELRALYPLAGLVRFANMSADRMRRLLRANEIAMVRSGRSLLVHSSEIERQIPPLWESIKSIKSLEMLRCEALRHVHCPS